MNHLQRFINVMEYQPVDQAPNWEAGVWPQTAERWYGEGLAEGSLHFDWFPGEPVIGLDPREFIHFKGGMMPPFPEKTLAEDEKTVTFQDSEGRVRRALKEGAIGGARLSMDQYLGFPVSNMDDWTEIKRRLNPSDHRRYEAYWNVFRVEGWRRRQHPLIFGPNTSTAGFYWTARELMGTVGLSYGWYDQPALLHDMMEFIADFLIESSRPMLEKTSIEYICLSEDLAMKTGPLLGPKTYKTFILPHLKRVIDFYKSNGVTYVCVDTDGNPEALIPMMLDAGVDSLWPLERAANQDPIRLRKMFGRSLRLWGGVDKREVAKGPQAIDAHLQSMAPLIEAGGFIPTIDHTASPDISWPNFLYYMNRKAELLRGGL